MDIRISEGSIFKETSTKRTNKWRVVVCVNGKRRTLGYYYTKTRAAMALLEFQQNPDVREMPTLDNLYRSWMGSRKGKISDKTYCSYVTAWNHLEPLGDNLISEISLPSLQKIIDGLSLSYSSVQKIKVLASQIWKYAIIQGYITLNLPEHISLPPKVHKEKDIFSDEDIEVLKNNIDIPFVDTILVLIYTGMRIGELLSLKDEHVFITEVEIEEGDTESEQLLPNSAMNYPVMGQNEWQEKSTNIMLDGNSNTRKVKIGYLKHGSKTRSGKNRVIPLHQSIIPIIEKQIEKPGILFVRNDKAITTDYYRRHIYYPLLEQLGLPRLNVHCTRHTLASLLNRYEQNKAGISKIMGHADYSTTANIYTHWDIVDLYKMIQKIP